MKDLSLSNNQFTSNGYYEKPWKGIEEFTHETLTEMCAIFDQNGFKMTGIEQLYCNQNFPGLATVYREKFNEVSGHHQWFTQGNKSEGAILNHSWLFQRKGFKGEARKQLERIAKKVPILYKVIKIKPKWGLDFSIDWCDKKGNVFEVVHWEWDSFDFNEIFEMKCVAEKLIKQYDWDEVGERFLKQKNEWYDLNFVAQSDWKCNQVGLKSERFNQVIWE